MLSHHLFEQYCYVQLTLSSVTFQGNIEMGPNNTGLIDMKCTVKGNKN